MRSLALAAASLLLSNWAAAAAAADHSADGRAVLWEPPLMTRNPLSSFYDDADDSNMFVYRATRPSVDVLPGADDPIEETVAPALLRTETHLDDDKHQLSAAKADWVIEIADPESSSDLPDARSNSDGLDVSVDVDLDLGLGLEGITGVDRAVRSEKPSLLPLETLAPPTDVAAITANTPNIDEQVAALLDNLAATLGASTPAEPPPVLSATPARTITDLISTTPEPPVVITKPADPISIPDENKDISAPVAQITTTTTTPSTASAVASAVAPAGSSTVLPAVLPVIASEPLHATDAAQTAVQTVATANEPVATQFAEEPLLPVLPEMPPPDDDRTLKFRRIGDADAIIDMQAAAAQATPAADLYSDEDAASLPPQSPETVEGSYVEELRTENPQPIPPVVGQTFQSPTGALVRLEASLGEQNGRYFFRARIDGVEQAHTAVWSINTAAEPPWSHIPDARIVRPKIRIPLDGAALRIFERPKGSTVIDYLVDDNRLLPAMATLELGIELAEILESLHGVGLYLYDLDPSQIVIERGGRVRLYAVNDLCTHGHHPVGQLGVFASPEVRQRNAHAMGAHCDVYSVALLIYALLAKHAPIAAGVDPHLLVSPRIFRPECPLGIWPYLRPCLSPNASQRIGYARALKHQLERARNRLLLEAEPDDGGPLFLESWTEMHIGITKARRGSPQQDRTFSVTFPDKRGGLYIIADGVSRSRYGDGAYAAEQVETAASQRWMALDKAGPQALNLSHAQRADVLKQIARTAGKRIATEVNSRCAPLPNEPNQVMSSTLNTAFIVNGEATIANLGDSRAYLVRDGTIEQITIDHDRATDALRMGLSFTEAQQVPMSSALTRIVGRVFIDEQGFCQADPFEPEIFRLRLFAGDRLVLCSDGVADFVAGVGAGPPMIEQKILETVLANPDPARACYELTVLANRTGGYDNISCIVVAAYQN